MLEVTASDIAALADDDLRTLVGLLCESELRKQGLPTSAVTWGGHQDAADGGIDVRVNLSVETAIDGFIPRAATGFQVKKPDMPASAITNEMRPSGILRPSIQSLADRKGAYIIACSTGSVTDQALDKRLAAMTNAVATAPNGQSLALDFYDRTRIATWVREHPGLIPSVRRMAGREIVGWQSYGTWANPDEGPSAEFMTDDASRIRTGANENGAGLTTVAGIDRIRKVLANSGSAVRLVGLSGVGKTRLVQALFEIGVGEQSLDPALALYTNTSDTPDPTPVGMVSDLVVAKSRAIVVVDNCPSDLHGRLAEVSRGSDVSVITVEYDIREDQPEGTEVFSLEPSSIEMIETVLRGRFQNVSQIDARRIADFSGGNFRVALALAGTVGRGDSVSGITDSELFERLFHQRQSPDPALLQAAEACSLLYSFDGETVAEDGELARLGKLVGQIAGELHHRVAELRRRDIVQARSKWRAVLPHAIANRLARLALQNIPSTAIESQLVASASERVKRSFSRRLGYLHDSNEARSIVERWLKPKGILSILATLDDLHAEILANVAPVAPDQVLAALEREALGPNRALLFKRRGNFIRMLRSIAYEPALFERSATLLADFAIENGEDGENEAANAFESLFFAYISGTHASVEQRISIMEGLVSSSDPKRQHIGQRALGALLEASHFSSMYDFEFGSLPRDFGYHPTRAERRAWYAAVLNSAEALARSGLPGGTEVPAIVASAFRGLWSDAQMHSELERTSRTIVSKGYWREGWIAVHQLLIYAKSDLSPEDKARLIALEKELRPADLIQKVRSIVLGSTSDSIYVDEYEEDDEDHGRAWERTEALAEQLGTEVINDDKTLLLLLPEILCGSGRLVNFGNGLGSNTQEPTKHWRVLTDGLVALHESDRNLQVLIGFLRGLSGQNPNLTESLLDEAVVDPILGPRFPTLQCAVRIDKPGVKRLRRSLKIGLAPIEEFRQLAWGRSLEPVSGTDLYVLLTEIADKPGGVEPALDILFFRLYRDDQANQPHEAETIETGRRLLSKLEFTQKGDRNDHYLGEIVRSCLSGSDSTSVARIVCGQFKVAAMADPSGVHHYHNFFESLCQTQPMVVLDVFLTGSPKQQRIVAVMLKWLTSHRRNPFDSIPDGVLIAWCNRDSAERYPAAASVVSFLKGSEEEDVTSHWTRRALKLIELAPDPVAVAQIFAKRFRPSGWSGSLASILQGRMVLLEELKEHNNQDIAAFAVEEAARLGPEVDAEREWEAERDRSHDERFE